MSDIFRSTFVGGGASNRAYAPLVTWIERVANEANLCVSQWHVLEVARIPGRDRDAMADWIDSVPLVWVRLHHRVAQDEDDYWLGLLAGLTEQNQVQPFAPSMLRAWETLHVAVTPGALADTTFPRAVHDQQQIGTGRIDRTTADRAEYLHNDRNDARWRGHESMGQENVAYKRRVDLRRRAMRAHERLLSASPPYAALGLTLNDVVDPFVGLAQANARSLPADKVAGRLHDGFAATASRRSPGSIGFGRMRSSGIDMFHAYVPAAYCDVFTCDGLTSDWLGDCGRHWDTVSS